MIYASLADLVLAFGEDEIVQITDRAMPPLGVPDATVAERALSAAQAEIDSYLASRHQLPLAAVPDVLRDCACDIARQRLHGAMVPDEVTRAYERRIAWLRDVSAGRATLGALTQTLPPPPTGLPEIVSGGRVFGDRNY